LGKKFPTLLKRAFEVIIRQNTYLCEAGTSSMITI